MVLNVLVCSLPKTGKNECNQLAGQPECNCEPICPCNFTIIPAVSLATLSHTTGNACDYRMSLVAALSYRATPYPTGAVGRVGLYTSPVGCRGRRGPTRWRMLRIARTVGLRIVPSDREHVGASAEEAEE